MTKNPHQMTEGAKQAQARMRLAGRTMESALQPTYDRTDDLARILKAHLPIKETTQIAKLLKGGIDITRLRRAMESE